MEFFSPSVLGAFLWQSTLLIGAALLLNAVAWRRCPAGRHIALRITLLLLPPLWFAVARPPSLSWLQSPTGGRVVEATPSIIDGLSRTSAVINAPMTWMTEQVTPAATAPPGTRLEPAHVFSTVWFLGAVLLLLRYISSRRRLRRLVAGGREVTDGAVRRRFMDLLAKQGVTRSVRLLEVEDLAGPATTGILRPTILVPVGFGRDRELTAALLHEILHLQRRDPLVLHIGSLLRAAFWFQPLVHLVVRSLRAESERAIDLAVVRMLGDPEAYVDQLHSLARSRVTVGSAIASFGHPRSLLRRRVEMILQHEKYRIPRHPLALAAFAALILTAGSLFLTLGACSEPDVIEEAPPEATNVIFTMHYADLPSRESSEPKPTYSVGVDEDGFYRLSVGLTDVTDVSVVPIHDRRNPDEETTLTGWKFHPDRQAIETAEPVDPKQHVLKVHGERAIPWSWNVAHWMDERREIIPESVRMLIDGRAGFAGKDYEYDESTGIVRMLKADDCHSGLRYHLSYSWQEPGSPGMVTTTGHMVGLSDNDLVELRRLNGLPVYEPEDGIDPHDIQGAGVWKTADASVYVTRRPVRMHGLRVAVRPDDQWATGGFLELNRDFTFDQKMQRLRLSDSLAYDPELQKVYVWGVLEDQNTYQFPGPIETGSIEFTFDDETLVEGKDYRVDYERNQVSLIDREFVTISTFEGGGVGTSYHNHTLRVGEWFIDRNLGRGR